MIFAYFCINSYFSITLSIMHFTHAKYRWLFYANMMTCIPELHNPTFSHGEESRSD